MRVVAVIPVFGRRPLIKRTIERLYQKNQVTKVICIGDVSKDKKVCESAGAEWLEHPNKPLGNKWNQGFIASRKYNPEACLFVGSSDWISDNWIETLGPRIREVDVIGLPGCYLLDIHTNQKGKNAFRAVHWPGYVGPRQGESIGIGRLISKRILEKINWMPFDSNIDHSLDYSMIKRVERAGGKIKTVATDVCQSVAISCNEWPNKHNFESHWNNRLPSKRINPDIVLKWFPEANQIFETQKITV